MRNCMISKVPLVTNIITFITVEYINFSFLWIAICLFKTDLFIYLLSHSEQKYEFVALWCYIWSIYFLFQINFRPQNVHNNELLVLGFPKNFFKTQFYNFCNDMNSLCCVFLFHARSPLWHFYSIYITI